MELSGRKLWHWRMGERLTETWKPIEGSWGYEVSSEGRVRCWRPIPHNAEPPVEARILKPKHAPNGYVYYILGYKGPTKYAHRLVAEAFIEGKGATVAHGNGIKTDNRVENLRWASFAENHADKLKHGTNGIKLTPELVREIRDAYVPGEVSQKKVGKMFGIAQGTVGKIVRGEYWKGVA